MNQQARAELRHFCLKLAVVMTHHNATLRALSRKSPLVELVAQDMEREGWNRKKFDNLLNHIEDVLFWSRVKRGSGEIPVIGNYGRRVPPRPNLDQLEHKRDGITRGRFGIWPAD